MERPGVRTGQHKEPLRHKTKKLSRDQATGLDQPLCLMPPALHSLVWLPSKSGCMFSTEQSRGSPQGRFPNALQRPNKLTNIVAVSPGSGGASRSRYRRVCLDICVNSELWNPGGQPHLNPLCINNSP